MTHPPVYPVGANTPPTLLFHGTGDMVISYRQSLRYQEALNAAGVRNKLVTVDGANHTEPVFFNNPDYIQDVLDFLKEYL